MVDNELERIYVDRRTREAGDEFTEGPPNLYITSYVFTIDKLKKGLKEYVKRRITKEMMWKKIVRSPSQRPTCRTSANHGWDPPCMEHSGVLQSIFM